MNTPLLSRAFFERSPLSCARALLGCELFRGTVSGRIVETEAYSTRNDPACHTAFRNQSRHFVADHPAGAIYVYRFRKGVGRKGVKG